MGLPNVIATGEERRVNILRALRRSGGNVEGAATLLGITRAVLWYHLRNLRMEGEPGRVREERRRFFTPPSTKGAA